MALSALRFDVKSTAMVKTIIPLSLVSMTKLLVKMMESRSPMNSTPVFQLNQKMEESIITLLESAIWRAQPGDCLTTVLVTLDWIPVAVICSKVKPA